MIKNGTKMENVKKLSEKSKNIEVFSKSYFKRLTNIFDNLDYKQIRRFEKILNEKEKRVIQFLLEMEDQFYSNDNI